jgi:hypothetical protein
LLTSHDVPLNPTGPTELRSADAPSLSGGLASA